MLQDGPTEPILQRSAAPQLPGAARAAQTIQAHLDVQDTMTTLADQLLVLFDEIPCARLIRQQRRAMHQHVQTYFRIADGVWEALATDQLCELAGNRSYNAAADALEQKLILIHEACGQAEQDPKARGGWLWRRRVRLYSRSLLEWKRCIDTGASRVLPDITVCGRALYRAHGRVGLASLSGFTYVLVMALPILGVLASLLLAFAFGATNILRGEQGRYLVPTALSSLIALYILWFSTAGPSPLPLVVGYALERRHTNIFGKALRISDTRPGALRRILRLLTTLLGIIFFAGLVTLLAFSILFARNFLLDLSSGAISGAEDYTATLLAAVLGHALPLEDNYFITVLLPVLCLGMIALFYLPFTLVVQARMTRVLISHPAHFPEARRYALRPALELLSFHAITLFFLAALALSFLNFGTASLLPASWPPVSERLLIYIIAFALPYLLLIDLPYRRGIARWRAARLQELTRRRNEIAQRLSRATPQPADQPDLRTIQDYLTWQYYHTLESEAKEVPSAPFPIERRILALALTILGSIALDQINTFLGGLLQLPS